MALWDAIVAAGDAPLGDPDPLERAYEDARREENWARRLFHALELSKRPRLARRPPALWRGMR